MAKYQPKHVDNFELINKVLFLDCINFTFEYAESKTGLNWLLLRKIINSLHLLLKFGSARENCGVLERGGRGVKWGARKCICNLSVFIFFNSKFKQIVYGGGTKKRPTYLNLKTITTPRVFLARTEVNDNEMLSLSA
jgi:hypothetical protein